MDEVVAAIAGPADHRRDGALVRMVVNVDPLEHEQMREDMIAYLAKYGRQNMLQWEDVDIIELRRKHDAISRLVKRENEANSSSPG